MRQFQLETSASEIHMFLGNAEKVCRPLLISFEHSLSVDQHACTKTKSFSVLSPTLAELFQLAGLHPRVLPHVRGRDARIDCSPHLSYLRLLDACEPVLRPGQVFAGERGVRVPAVYLSSAFLAFLRLVA